MLELILAGAATAVGYFPSKKFVKEKLRFVDAAQSMQAPIVAGVAAAVVAAPVVWILPVVGAGTAILFGIGVGAGVRSGAKSIRRYLGSGE